MSPAIKARDFKGPGSFVGDSDGAALITHTLRAERHDASEDGTGRGIPLVPTYSFTLRGREGGAMPEMDGEVVGALRAANGGSSRSYVHAEPLSRNQTPATFAPRRGVRRMMPHELERLQGFPDHYTLLPDQQRKAVADDYAGWYAARFPELSREQIERLSKDGPRAKALGNSMAVPVMRWIGERIAIVDALPQTAQHSR